MEIPEDVTKEQLTNDLMKLRQHMDGLPKIVEDKNKYLEDLREPSWLQSRGIAEVRSRCPPAGALSGEAFPMNEVNSLKKKSSRIPGSL